MCIVMLRILNFSYTNGKSNDLFTKKSTRNQKYNNRETEKLEIRSTILFFKLTSYHYGYGRSCAIIVSLLSSILHTKENSDEIL